ncbi:methylaspartate mutase epsilon subunit [Actinoplanes octamycinicus]|uniref:Methylaspartate mutase epsilon subunit n=1 Tax=Actinoplanes octamycinicus TaxID=135948 RepID=A0A7W7MD21_9ACTN|nr:methylaspartate mutase [Actinoplanes octamycinicus]MBB4745787.1 methylaspartate mutase epsilon subunit [Actinoplanes octamycinicus]GIE63859.1 methylaspartate mutase [Actinoplanes octamycinicus]
MSPGDTRSRDGATDSPPIDFGEFVRRRGGRGSLVVQPRMGFSDPARMRAGLLATRAARATTVGTITLDSYTRVGELAAAGRALADGVPLNGYPIVNHPPAVTGALLDGVRGDDFPIQVRHGSAVPADIFAALARLRLNATEGGPVSYCLPYGRTPLAESITNWRRGTEVFAALRDQGVEPHLETFGGCMMGQLCPPGQLVAISVLEALFFHQHGIRSLSVSYAQQTSYDQDVEALLALRRLCAELLPTRNWHVVVYAYMGMYPVTAGGAYRLLDRAAELAAVTGAERLIVKTEAEARRIPTVAENITALERAGAVRRRVPLDPGIDTETYAEAAALVHAVLNLDADLGRALLAAFRHGVLDVPYCLHPDNMGRTRSYLDDYGRLRWAATGSMPLPGATRRRPRALTSAGLLSDLSYIRRSYDRVPT